MTEEQINLGSHPLEGKFVVGDRYISLRIFCAELYGIALFIYFGDGAMAQVLIGTYFTRGIREEPSKSHGNATAVGTERQRSPTKLPFEFDYGDFLTIAFAYGLGLALAIAACGAVSGGHLNPAVTLTEVVFRRLPATVLPVYLIAQLFGSFIGVGFLHTIHFLKLLELQQLDVDVTSVFFTSPVIRNHDVVTLIWDQTVGSAAYMFVYLAMDDKNTGIKSKPLRVVILGATYTMILLALGINAGAAINPARDFVPRIFAYIVGHQDAFQNFTFIPLIIPFFGSILGGSIYEVCIRFLRPDEVEDEEKAVLENIMKVLEELEGTVRGMKSQGLPTTLAPTSVDDTTQELNITDSQMTRRVASSSPKSRRGKKMEERGRKSSRLSASSEGDSKGRRGTVTPSIYKEEDETVNLPPKSTARREKSGEPVQIARSARTDENEGTRTPSIYKESSSAQSTPTDDVQSSQHTFGFAQEPSVTTSTQKNKKQL